MGIPQPAAKRKKGRMAKEFLRRPGKSFRSPTPIHARLEGLGGAHEIFP